MKVNGYVCIVDIEYKSACNTPFALRLGWWSLVWKAPFELRINLVVFVCIFVGSMLQFKLLTYLVAVLWVWMIWFTVFEAMEVTLSVVSSEKFSWRRASVPGCVVLGKIKRKLSIGICLQWLCKILDLNIWYLSPSSLGVSWSPWSVGARVCWRHNNFRLLYWLTLWS
jgi:hypothetical protein